MKLCGRVCGAVGQVGALGLGAAILLLLIVSCATAAASVSSIQGDPDRYVGRTVTVQGEVGAGSNVPFLDASVYLLSDESDDGASMGVIGTGGAPETGEFHRVEVKVAGITQDRTADVADSAVSVVADFLVDQNIVGRDDADGVATRIVEFAESAGGFAAGSYLLVEQ